MFGSVRWTGRAHRTARLAERSRAVLCALPVHLFLSKYFNVLGRKVFGTVSMDIVVCGRGSIFVFFCEAPGRRFFYCIC